MKAISCRFKSCFPHFRTLDFSRVLLLFYVTFKPDGYFQNFDINDCDGLPGEIDYFSILDASADNNKLTLSILDDFHNSFYELYVVSPAVDFIVIEGENGQSQPGR